MAPYRPGLCRKCLRCMDACPYDAVAVVNQKLWWTWKMRRLPLCAALLRPGGREVF